MADTTTKKKSSKKAIIIAVAAVLVLAVIAAAVVLVLKNGGDNGPEDANGNPLYPKASNVTEVEYLHRGGLDSNDGLVIAEKEITDAADVEDFLTQLKAVELKDPTDKDRASIDYTADVEMFTLKEKDGKEDVLLVMGKSLSINNEYGNYFYMTEGLDLDALTKNFVAMDLSDKIASADDAEADTSK